MPRTMKVVATGNPVPMENRPGARITSEPVEVEETTYYVRRIADGELREVAADKAAGKGK